MADFFELQERARKKTRLLVLLFFLALVTTALAVDLVVFLFMIEQHKTPFLTQWWRHLTSGPGLMTIGITWSIILIGTLATLNSIAKGGKHIAQLVGATPIPTNTNNLKIRQLRNIADEMAIAAGIPQPELYILENEPGINAFVAGLSSDDTIMVVTQGLLDNLNREEIQAVVGHEYSHILNTDMKLNLQLWGWLGGLLMIAQIGRFLIDTQRYRSSSRRNKSASQIMFAGLLLVIIGYVSLFFGRLIKAAVSRQREFLADASSVQFTRNKDAMINTLMAIANHTSQGHLQNKKRESMSHMCFAEPMSVWFSSLLSTHPPIEKRIQALEPALTQKSIERLVQRRRNRHTVSPQQNNAPQRSSDPQREAQHDMVGAAVLAAQIGTLSETHIRAAQKQLQSVPSDLLDACRKQPELAQKAYLLLAVMADYGHQHPAVNQWLDSHVPDKNKRQILGQLTQISPEGRMVTALKLLEVLKTEDQQTRLAFCEALKALCLSNQRMTFSEYSLIALAWRRLALLPPHRGKNITRLRQAQSALAIVLSQTVYLSGNDPVAQTKTFEHFWRRFALGTEDYRGSVSLPQLHQALLTLARLNPMLKKSVMQTLIDAVEHDGRITLPEYEWIRVLGEYLEIPVPAMSISASGAKSEQG